MIIEQIKYPQLINIISTTWHSLILTYLIKLFKNLIRILVIYFLHKTSRRHERLAKLIIKIVSTEARNRCACKGILHANSCRSTIIPCSVYLFICLYKEKKTRGAWCRKCCLTKFQRNFPRVPLTSKPLSLGISFTEFFCFYAMWNPAIVRRYGWMCNAFVNAYLRVNRINWNTFINITNINTFTSDNLQISRNYFLKLKTVSLC